MNWKDISNVVSEVAPTLGTILGGPAGGSIGSAISSLLGVDDAPEKVVEVLKTNPDALLKLKEYEMQYKGKLQELQLENVKSVMDDIQNARNRQIKHEKATGTSDINLYVLAWIVVFGFFTLLGLTFFIAIPDDSNGVVFTLFGTLSTGFGMVLQYFFGSSAGSKMKTTMMTKQQQ